MFGARSRRKFGNYPLSSQLGKTFILKGQHDILIIWRMGAGYFFWCLYCWCWVLNTTWVVFLCAMYCFNIYIHLKKNLQFCFQFTKQVSNWAKWFFTAVETAETTAAWSADKHVDEFCKKTRNVAPVECLAVEYSLKIVHCEQLHACGAAYAFEASQVREFARSVWRQDAVDSTQHLTHCSTSTRCDALCPLQTEKGAWLTDLRSRAGRLRWRRRLAACRPPPPRSPCGPCCAACSAAPPQKWTRSRPAGTKTLPVFNNVLSLPRSLLLGTSFCDSSWDLLVWLELWISNFCAMQDGLKLVSNTSQRFEHCASHACMHWRWVSTNLVENPKNFLDFFLTVQELHLAQHDSGELFQRYLPVPWKKISKISLW